MSILIKNMKMPETCEHCVLESFCGLWVEARELCGWTPENREAAIRHPNCPLIELPPHGDLIDRDALNIDISESVVFTVAKNRPSSEMRGAFKVLDRLEIAPTIIEAEDGE